MTLLYKIIRCVGFQRCVSAVFGPENPISSQVSAAGEVLVANRFEAYPGRWDGPLVETRAVMRGSTQ